MRCSGIGQKRIKRWIIIAWCVLLHKKEICEFLLPDEIFTFNLGKFRGCRKCDVWRQID